jgi:phosphoglycerate dehydrogenase-like enzyme
MKPILLSSKSSHQDLLTYRPDLFNRLVTEFHGVAYDQIEPDFSNIPELFDDEEKLVMFNHFAIPNGFHAFSKYLPTFKNVKFLLSPYSAYEGLDLDLLKKMGIKYRNNGGANAKSVAQYAIMASFMLLSKYPVFTQSNTMPDGSILGEERFGKTAGIIGLGNVGKEILDTLNRLGIETVYYNRSEENVSAKKVELSEIFKQDLVFVSIATSPQTQELLKDLPTLLQPHNYLIDISATDELYDKKSVVKLLDQDKIKGFALEVFNPQEFKLASQKNLIATPHIAWCTKDAEERTVDNYLNRGLMVLQGESDKVDFIV